jgi:hypothetical protein
VPGVDREETAGIEATVAVGRSEQVGEALLIGLEGGLIAELKLLLPGQDRCLEIEATHCCCCCASADLAAAKGWYSETARITGDACLFVGLNRSLWACRAGVRNSP